MRNPPHPGRSIRENCLEPLGLNVSEAAKVLGVARHTLSRVLNGHAAISPEMAIRLETTGWSNAEFWLRRQTAYDLVQARKQESRIDVERYEPQPAARRDADRTRCLRPVRDDSLCEKRTNRIPLPLGEGGRRGANRLHG